MDGDGRCWTVAKDFCAIGFQYVIVRPGICNRYDLRFNMNSF
jgi:hypothetical protein